MTPPWVAAASQGVGRVETTWNMLYVEAELLDLVQPARKEPVDVPLGAQPRDRLVVRPEREIREGPRRAGSPTSKQVVAKHPKGVDHREQLEDVRWVGLFGSGEFTAFVGHRVVMTVVIWLGEDG